MQTLKGPRSTIFDIAFSADGRYLAAGYHRLVNLWDTTSGTLTRTWALSGYCGGVVFSPDGQLLAASDGNLGHGGTKGLVVWRIDRPDPLPVLRAGDAWGFLWFHPDGWLLTQSPRDYRLTRWDLDIGAGRPLWDDPSAWDTGYCQAAVSPQADRIVRVAGYDKRLEVFDLVSGHLMRTVHMREGGGPFRGEFLADGRHFAVTNKNQLLVFDLDSGAEVLVRKTGRRGIYHLAVSPTGNKVITAPQGKDVQVWTPGDWPDPQVYTWPVGRVSALTIAPDGQRAAVAGGSGVVIWDLDA
jgi:WD40 repeat protein